MLLAQSFAPFGEGWAGQAVLRSANAELNTGQSGTYIGELILSLRLCLRLLLLRGGGWSGWVGDRHRESCRAGRGS
jgi:hypothetical protein